jgi:serine/threonine-protein kinase
MEYLAGLTLDEVVRRHGPLPPARAVHLVRQLCSALRAAHGIGLIHRDIKPGNVILCSHGIPHDRVKLLDFGLVRPAGVDEPGARLTREGIIVGTPEYMSPEQAEGKSAIDPRSDLYSLGALAYFLLAGRPPFHNSSGMRVLIDHLQTPVPSLRNYCPDVPAEVEAVVHRCLAKSADERFADAGSLDRALAACAGITLWTEEQTAAWWQKAAEAMPGPGDAPGTRTVESQPPQSEPATKTPSF